jgi:hypothetical protein
MDGLKPCLTPPNADIRRLEALKAQRDAALQRVADCAALGAAAADQVRAAADAAGAATWAYNVARLEVVERHNAYCLECRRVKRGE